MDDLISRQDAYDVLTDYYHHRTEIQHKGLKEALSRVPSVQSKQLQILANVLDGCPLTQPCDKLWKPEGWCKEHCKTHEPDAECWLKYAEVMAADDT